MGVFDRILLFVYSFAIVLLTMFGIVVGFSTLFGVQAVEQYIQEIQSLDQFLVLAVGFCILFLLLSFRIVWISFKRGNTYDNGIDQETEIGSVHISLLTIEEIVIRSAKRVKGVHDLKARVYYDPKESNLSIGLKIIIDGKTPIQSLSEELQRVVKEQVETIAGVDVDQVSVFVAQTKKPSQNRLRVS